MSSEFCDVCGHCVAYHRYNGCHPIATRDCPCTLAPIDFWVGVTGEAEK